MTVLDYAAIGDVGTILNPRGLKGQLFGGSMLGLAWSSLAGVAVSVLYIIPLLMTVPSSRERDPLYFCVAATMLLWAELFVRPASLLIQYAVLNRALGMLVLWLVAWGLFELKRTQSELLTVETNRSKALQDLMSERVERSHAEGAASDGGRSQEGDHYVRRLLGADVHDVSLHQRKQLRH